MAENASVSCGTFRHYNTVEWKIKSFLNIHQKVGECLESPIFSAFNADFCISIYPYGRNSDYIGWISLFVTKKSDNVIGRRISMSFGIKDINGSVFNSINLEYAFDKEDRGRGSPQYLRRSRLERPKDLVSSEGTLTVSCTFPVVDTCVKDTASQTLLADYTGKISEDFKDLFISEYLWDIKIKVKDQEFKAHKSVLAARSPVFASMFEHEMTEKSSGVVDIDDCEQDSFKDFLLFLYTGKADSLSSKNIVSLYKTADKYDVEELKVECSRRLKTNMSIDMICDIIHLALIHSESEILISATDFFIENAEKIIQTKKWPTFYEENITLGNELLIKMMKRNHQGRNTK